MEDIKKDSFNAHAFIETISDTLLPTAIHSTEDGRTDLFDPEPFHIAFDHTFKNLQVLREQVDKMIDNRGKGCQESEKDYKSKLKEVQTIFLKVQESFQSLDTRISIISQKAVRIGQSLESVETERANAENAKKLIRLIMNLNSPTDRESTIQTLLQATGSYDDEMAMESAMTVKDLKIIAKELDIDQTEKAKLAIQELHAAVEDQLLKKFVDASKKKLYDQMRNVAAILFAFNGGESCILAYLDTLDFLKEGYQPQLKKPEIVITKEKSKEEDEDSSSSDKDNAVDNEDDFPQVEELNLAELGITIPDDSAQQPGAAAPPDFNLNQSKLDTFFSELLQNIEQTHEVILKVFNNPLEVLDLLIRRTITNRIYFFVNNMLKDKRDLECYLKTFANAMQNSKKLLDATTHLTNKPKLHMSNVIQMFMGENNGENFKNLFIDYIGTEVKSLVQFLNSLIEEQLEEKKKELERKKQEELEAKSKITGLVGMAGRILGQEETQPEIELTEGTAQLFIARVREAVDRCTLLSTDDTISSNVTRVFKTLIREYGHKYMHSCLHRLVQRISVEEPRTEPQTKTFFACVALTNSNIISIQQLFFTKVRPHIEGSRNEQTVCINEKHSLLMSLEELIVQGSTKILSLLTIWIKKLLVRDQGRSDFRPSDNEVSIGEITKACRSVCSFVDSQHQIVSCYLDGKNRDVFLSELGKRLLDAILAHIRTFTISFGSGSLSLMTDLRKYRETVAKFNIPSLNAEFELLYHIEKIYMVKAEELKGIIEDSPLKGMKQQELESYLSKRSDFNRSWVGKYF